MFLICFICNLSSFSFLIRFVYIYFFFFLDQTTKGLLYSNLLKESTSGVTNHSHGYFVFCSLVSILILILFHSFYFIWAYSILLLTVAAAHSPPHAHIHLRASHMLTCWLELKAYLICSLWDCTVLCPWCPSSPCFPSLNSMVHYFQYSLSFSPFRIFCKTTVLFKSNFLPVPLQHLHN